MLQDEAHNKHYYGDQESETRLPRDLGQKQNLLV